LTKGEVEGKNHVKTPSGKKKNNQSGWGGTEIKLNFKAKRKKAKTRNKQSSFGE